MSRSTPPTADAPDPVGEAQAYQEYMVRLLGDDDPAAVQSRSIGAWRTMVDSAGEHLHEAPAEGEWSVYGCLAHAFDAEIVMSGRYRWIVAHDEPPIVGYDQDLWVRRLHEDPDTEPAADLLVAFGAVRAANVAMWRRSTPEQRARVGLHEERGPESYDLAFRMIAGHDRFHLQQAREALEAATS